MRLSIPKLSAKTVAVLLLAVSLAVYATGLLNPFMGDDNDQIIHNTPVHSLHHLGDIFSSGTFFNGTGKTQLTGVYYRPLMLVSYALIYTLCGPHPLAFHLFQLLVFVCGALLVFLVLRCFVKPGWALAASLIFLVHPLNSQAVFSIPTLQDPLYFAFGMLGLWLLLRSNSNRALIGSLLCLLLSLLSKETGVVFLAVIFVYLLLFNRKRMVPFAAGAVLVLIVYLALKIHAVGLAKPTHIAPIDNFSLLTRVSNIPALIVHYLSLALWPAHLASNYYWVYPVSLVHFWVPLMLVLSLLLFAVYLGVELHRLSGRRPFLTYLFFAAWTVLGLLPHLQLIPLDMTACDTWFLVSMVGLLGTLCLLGQTYLRAANSKWLVPLLVLLVVLLGLRTAARGLDWRGGGTLALADLKASPDNFVAEYQLALALKSHGLLSQAEALARQSVDTYPTGTDWDVLGKVLMSEQKYAEAKQAFDAGIQHEEIYQLVQDEAALSVVWGDPSISVAKLEAWAKTYPNNPSILSAVAVANYRAGHLNAAKSAITTAHHLSPTNTTISGLYDEITSNQVLLIH